MKLPIKIDGKEIVGDIEEHVIRISRTEAKFICKIRFHEPIEPFADFKKISICGLKTEVYYGDAGTVIEVNGRDSSIHKWLVDHHVSVHFHLMNGMPNTEASKEKRDTGWIKVTHETMPKDYELVIVTCRDHKDHKFRWITKDAFLENGAWMSVKDWIVFRTQYITNGAVTHWMPYPTPAED